MVLLERIRTLLPRYTDVSSFCHKSDSAPRLARLVLLECMGYFFCCLAQQNSCLPALNPPNISHMRSLTHNSLSSPCFQPSPMTAYQPFDTVRRVAYLCLSGGGETNWPEERKEHQATDSKGGRKAQHPWGSCVTGKQRLNEPGPRLQVIRAEATDGVYGARQQAKDGF